MPDRNGHHALQPTPTTEPDLTPRASQIIGHPTTVEEAQQDYASAADIRARLDEQIRGHR